MTRRVQFGRSVLHRLPSLLPWVSGQQLVVEPVLELAGVQDGQEEAVTEQVVVAVLAQKQVFALALDFGNFEPEQLHVPATWL